MRSIFLASSLVAVCEGANIVELAQATPELATLVQAVVAADLVDTLSAPGTFTVFAPTNAAFAALPAGVLDDLLKPENKAALSDVLTYHVLGHEFKYDGSKGPGTIAYGNGYSGNPNIAGAYDSVLGKPLFITKGGVGALGAQQSVLASNIAADNGVVHIINGVMLPSLVESGRSIDLYSFKEHVVVEEGRCYNRQFNGTSGTGATGNDQRAFCTEVKLPNFYDHGHLITDRYSRKVTAYQYSSNDGSCQNPRISDPNHIGVYAQGSNDFPTLTHVGRYNENIEWFCPGDKQPGDEQIVV